MDNSKAAFINTVADGELVPCPNCNHLNKKNAKFCASCGNTMAATPAVQSFSTIESQVVASVAEVSPATQAFSTVSTQAVASQTPTAQVFSTVAPQVIVEEEQSVFAQGLPSWNIEPPQVVVRRKRK